MAGDDAGPTPPGDLLAGAAWECAATPPGERAGPDDLAGVDLGWTAATVPGTVASALRDGGLPEPTLDDLDGRDWWFRCRFDGPVAPAPDGWVLGSGGLATLADVWLNGEHLLRSESMFATHRVSVAAVGGHNELWLRFAALTPVLQQRRPRPRWKYTGLSSQNLRWFRTTLRGRQAGWAEVPAPVGPWRPLTLRPAGAVEVVASQVLASCPSHTDGPGPGPGAVRVVVELAGAGVRSEEGPRSAELVVDGRRAPLDVRREDGRIVASGELLLDVVDRWWPHTHGDQPLYPVAVEVEGVVLELGEVGFRTIEVDRSDEGFQLSVNGVPVFCRGACWYPVDPVGYQASDAELEHTVGLARTGGMNMLRIPGGTVYEDERFFELCDRTGILVWQDLMLGPVDPPDDQEFLDTVRDEATDQLDRAGRHPSLAVVCGGQQVEEQPAMFGLDRERWRSPIIHDVLPALVANRFPGVPYLSSSPSGGDFPFQADSGVSHYFGVGMGRLPLEDLRRSDPRFVSEGLANAVPPERATVDEVFGGDLITHLASGWQRGVHRDAGSWYDLEAVRDHYAASLFRADIDELWRTDPDRALDLGRAAVAEIRSAAVAEWRRPGSRCAGMLGIALRDLRHGAGWGLVDASGRPKAPWFVLRRGFAPVAVLVTDEELNGLGLHLVNDLAEPVEGTVVVGLHTASHQVEEAAHPVTVPARGGLAVRADALFDGFRDLSYAYRFGPRPFELVTVDLRDAAGAVVASTGYLPGGAARGLDPDLGLQAQLEPADGGVWLLTVSTRRFAQYVHVDVPGFTPDDSWFHLPPGGSSSTVLRPEPATEGTPRGRVRALNSLATSPVAP